MRSRKCPDAIESTTIGPVHFPHRISSMPGQSRLHVAGYAMRRDENNRQGFTLVSQRRGLPNEVPLMCPCLGGHFVDIRTLIGPCRIGYN